MKQIKTSPNKKKGYKLREDKYKKMRDYLNGNDKSNSKSDK